MTEMEIMRVWLQLYAISEARHKKTSIDISVFCVFRVRYNFVSILRPHVLFDKIWSEFRLKLKPFSCFEIKNE